ncbi:hypothetical protein Efla_005933 [Eimeria flavescens]
MDFYETTYCAFHGPRNSLLAGGSRLEAEKGAFFRAPKHRGPLWGFNEQTLPGVPGPQWLCEGGTSSGAEAAAEKEGVGDPPLSIRKEGPPSFPLSTYKDAYRVQRRQLPVVYYDASEAPPQVGPSGGCGPQEERAACSSSSMLLSPPEAHRRPEGNRLYASLLKSDRRHDTLSDGMPKTELETAHTRLSRQFETSSREIGKHLNEGQTARQLCRQDERRRAMKERAAQRAGLNHFQDTLRAFPPKREACNLLLAAAGAAYHPSPARGVLSLWRFLPVCLRHLAANAVNERGSACQAFESLRFMRLSVFCLFVSDEWRPLSEPLADLFRWTGSSDEYVCLTVKGEAIQLLTKARLQPLF